MFLVHLFTRLVEIERLEVSRQPCDQLLSLPLGDGRTGGPPKVSHRGVV